MGLENMGQDAYNKIMACNFKEATIILSKAIALHPDDCRLYSNRCYCYLEMYEFDSARRDATTLKQKNATYWAGYYLLGECLMQAKRHKEAETEYHRAYQLNPNEVVADRLFEAQMHQILARGHDPILSRKALLSTRLVQEALSSLAMNDVQEAECVQGPAMAFSAEEEKHLMTELGKYAKETKKAAARAPLIRIASTPVPVKIDPMSDPSNPLKSKSLWVGNLTRNAEEAQLKKLFGRLGKVDSVFVRDGHAFVNYSDWTSAAKAMQTLQGTVYNSKKLMLKYPDSAKK